ncbi:MAG: DUF4810 domain-containing protein [Candidatus Cloacimonetes bacterium]|nr:DUF4810 domain-containing protein [Candidatus Cloacimonadota bacterium]
MRKLVILMFLAVVLLSGCVSSQYYWGNYSHTLYKYKKVQDDENLAKHKECIEKIIRKSEAQSKKVPPGIYCEYGYYLIMEGETALGTEYLDKEVSAYPESEAFVKTLKSQMELEKEQSDE